MVGTVCEAGKAHFFSGTSNLIFSKKVQSLSADFIETFLFCLVRICPYLCLVFYVVYVSSYRLCCLSFPSCCVMIHHWPPNKGKSAFIENCCLQHSKCPLSIIYHIITMNSPQCFCLLNLCIIHIKILHMPLYIFIGQSISYVWLPILTAHLN